MERGVRGGISGRLGPSCLRSDGLGRFGSLALLSAPLLDAYPATKTCWVAARTSSSSIEYLLARRNKSSIVVGGFLASDFKKWGVWTDTLLEDLQDSIHAVSLYL